MRNTHHMFRAISLAIGLTLLVVTGTAAMIAAFSGPASTPRAYGAMTSRWCLLPCQPLRKPFLWRVTITCSTSA